MKIEGGSWAIEGVEGHILVRDGEYRFGPKKKDYRETVARAYAEKTCYYKFKLTNATNRYLQIKTMGKMVDKSGKVLDKVITCFYQEFEPGQERIVKGYFGVTREEALQTDQLAVEVVDYHIE